ncbi:hypothetical protein PHAVU_002G109800 [Phaseolus vulgaris]|uniref:Uncharacterized protein n=1 Tax=Phaseolus vulgaris TaxID=3885 RepID=V7CI99_PHAVU|nr:hypothetical protein PHAVU_002G109800g [Phaseolus vulgaris]ESW29922.1 hypothetical protein PHAVU_002G109800g [Phaseolus vulgaris]
MLPHGTCFCYSSMEHGYATSPWNLLQPSLHHKTACLQSAGKCQDKASSVAVGVQALVQFHALALLHQIRQNDRLAVSKLVTSLTRGTIRSPLSWCLLIRYTSQVIYESDNNTQAGNVIILTIAFVKSQRW